MRHTREKQRHVDAHTTSVETRRATLPELAHMAYVNDSNHTVRRALTSVAYCCRGSVIKP
jgi:hypothetical protein